MAQFDPSIFLQGAQLSQQSNSDLLGTLKDLVNRYQQNKQYQQKVKLAEAQEVAKQAQDPVNMLMAIQAGTATPEQQARFDAYQQLQAAQVGSNMLGEPYQKYRPINTGQASPSQQSQPMQPAPQGGMDILPPPSASDFKKPQERQTPAMPGVTQRDMQSPLGRAELTKGEVSFQSKKMLRQLELDEKKAMTDQQKNAAQFVINRMSEINEELKRLNEISSEESGVLTRAKNVAEGTGIGQGLEKAIDPKAQALRDEYKKLQSTFLPFYASAAGLGAKSLDSEGERKSILDSFGDPAGLYESNKRQLGNLSELIGTGKKPEGKEAPQEVMDWQEFFK